MFLESFSQKPTCYKEIICLAARVTSVMETTTDREVLLAERELVGIGMDDYCALSCYW